MKNTLIHKGTGLCLLFTIFLLSSCTEEAIIPNPPTASFDIEVVENERNKWILTSTSSNETQILWRYGNVAIEDENAITVHFPEDGSYRVTLTVTGPGGYANAEHTFVIGEVEGADPKELVVGGDMKSEEGWTITDMGDDLTSIEFSNDGLIFSNGTNVSTNIAIWQAIEVVAGQKYQFSAQVKGSGAHQSWFELFFGDDEPEVGNDYTDGVFVALSTWAGCATSPFEGNLVDLSCSDDAPGTGSDGIIEFGEDKVIYLVIKVGSWEGSLGDEGITIKDVSLKIIDEGGDD